MMARHPGGLAPLPGQWGAVARRTTLLDHAKVIVALFRSSSAMNGSCTDVRNMEYQARKRFLKHKYLDLKKLLKKTITHPSQFIERLYRGEEINARTSGKARLQSTITAVSVSSALWPSCGLLGCRLSHAVLRALWHCFGCPAHRLSLRASSFLWCPCLPQ